jgi:oligopeptide/dipeptide ABC transporter ATP-binding protein
MSNEPLLVVEGLTKEFTPRRRWTSPHTARPALRAVDNVSITVNRGETFGIVGESGCGKSTFSRAVLRLTEPTAGTVTFKGIAVLELNKRDLRQLRRDMQILFQDPFGSLDSRMSVQSIVAEPLEIHGEGDRRRRAIRAAEALELVGIPANQLDRKPQAFSGGQRQRVGLARAIVLEPELIFLDEPISALDVSIQAQVLNLLRDLQERLALTYVFIVHDLAIAEYFCDRIAVLYAGAVMEVASRDALFLDPLHPYTVSLLSAVPVADPDSQHRRERIVLKGEVQASERPAVGCRFRPRCPVGHDRPLCATIEPDLVEHRPGHRAACHYPGELAASRNQTLPRHRP